MQNHSQRTVSAAERKPERNIIQQLLRGLLRDLNTLPKVLFGLLNSAFAVRQVAQAEATLSLPGAVGRNIGELESESFEDVQGRLKRSVRVLQPACSPPMMSAESLMKNSQLFSALL